ncbi:MAG TPA: hypothetical protein ACFYED_09410 [Candidatus Tripitaka californicus]|uniref:hypothetical protein n=1 Tax=Candidatus Tripitaka californicus TaxID=3367616 RepID=UPI004027C20A|nr:hypothetical protein [Planctomycetota bacterium]
MHLLQAVVAGLVILILVLGFFAFHVWMRLYVWPETYRKKEKEGDLRGSSAAVRQEGSGTPGIKEATAKARKKPNPPAKDRG